MTQRQINKLKVGDRVAIRYDNGVYAEYYVFAVNKGMGVVLKNERGDVLNCLSFSRGSILARMGYLVQGGGIGSRRTTPGPELPNLVSNEQCSQVEVCHVR